MNARVAVVVLVAACGSAAPTPTIANRSTGTAATVSASCRAQVTKHYGPSETRQTDPITGRTFVVTDSDPCGLVLMPIYFEHGSAAFEPEAVDRLAGMLACMDQTDHMRLQMELVGHRAPDEPEALAGKRAEAVVRYLTACGVPSLGFTASADTTVETDERARRVDYVITKRTP